MSAPTQEDAATRRWQNGTLAAACLAQFMIQLDVTIVNVTLPSIQRALGVSPTRLVWTLNAYVLPLASLILVGGTLGDRFGRRRLFLIGCALFTLFSIGCALSPDDTVLIAFRALQGLGAALLAPASLSILTHAYPPERRPWAFGMWATLSGLGFGMGPVIAGVLLRFFEWPSIFWVNVPIGVAAVVVAATWVRESKNPHAHRLDVVGALLASTMLFSATLALLHTGHGGSGSSLTLVLLVLAVLLAIAFFVWESRHDAPMLPLAFFRRRVFAFANASFMLAYAALATTLFFVSIYFQNVQGYTPLQTGLSWLGMNIPFLSVASSAGRLQARFGARAVVVTGLAVGAAGILVFALLDVHATYALALPGYVMFGAGYGAAVPAISSIAMSAIAVEHAGVASGVLNTARQVGAAIGLPALSALALASSPGPWSDPEAFVSGMHVALAAASALVFLGALLSAWRSSPGSDA